MDSILSVELVKLLVAVSLIATAGVAGTLLSLYAMDAVKDWMAKRKSDENL